MFLTAWLNPSTTKLSLSLKKESLTSNSKNKISTIKLEFPFKLKSSYPIDDLKDLGISIENKSDNVAVYVDWDNSSLVVEHSKQSRRVIRKSPDLTRDLAVPQSPSLIAPKTTLLETVTAEDVFERDQVTGTYLAKKPLIDINGLQKGQKKLYNDFINRRKELDFSLQLVLRISEVRLGLSPGRDFPAISIINCPFTVRKLPWTYALPWNKKK